MENRIDKALDWDSKISYEQPDFVTLPEGVYPITITKLERKQFEGSKREGGLPACPMAEVTVEARGKDGVSIFTQRLFLHSRCEGILTSFFTCIGLRKKGDDLNMDWGKVEGCTGWAKLTVREFTTRNGNEMTVNDVGRWLAPDDYRIPKDDGGDDW